MNDIDDQIRNALTEDERRLIADLQEQVGLFDMLSMALRGKQAWLTWYMWIMGVVVFLAGIYCFMQFLGSDDLHNSLAWMLGINVCISIIVIIKVVGWTQMSKLELMREIKRLELRLISSSKSQAS